MRFKAFIFELEGVLVDTSLLLNRQEASYANPFQDDFSHEYLKEGAEELLLQLKRQGVKTAVVSTARYFSLSLNHLGLLNYADRVLSFNEHPLSESSGNAFIDAAKLLQINPKRCVGVVGCVTSLTNVKAANMYVIGIGPPEIIGAADITFSHLKDIILNDL